MDFQRNPIEFLDDIVTRHKARLKDRRIASETLAYMGENVDQAGRGLEFMRHYVHNDAAVNKDLNDPNTDVSLLELYDYWRARYNMRPVFTQPRPIADVPILNFE